MWADLQFSEAKMAILGLFPGNIVLLGCISVIIEFDVLCILWVFTLDVPLMEKPGCWKSDILSKDSGQWSVSSLKMSLPQVFFSHFAGANQVPGFSVSEILGRYKWVKEASSKNIGHKNLTFEY